MRLSSLCVCVCVCWGTAMGQGITSFSLLSPPAGDTLYAGDTVAIRWEHDTTMSGVIVRISWDDGENYTRLGHVMYWGPDSAFMHVFDGYGEYVEGSCTVATVNDSLIRGGFDWVAPSGWDGLPDTGWAFMFSMMEFGGYGHWPSGSVYRAMPAPAGVSTQWMRLPRYEHSSPVSQYDLRGRLLTTRTPELPASVVIKPRPNGTHRRLIHTGGRP